MCFHSHGGVFLNSHLPALEGWDGVFGVEHTESNQGMSCGGSVDHNEFDQSLPFNQQVFLVSGTSGKQGQAYSVHSFVLAPSCA